MTNATKRATPGQDVFLAEYLGQFAQREPLAATAYWARLFEALEQAAQLGAEEETARLMQLQSQVETLTTSFAPTTRR